ncbi:MAG: phosphotransferase [Pseudomonadales bacterium]|nr:phosphotransferase [Pseudomonadales bacterium]
MNQNSKAPVSSRLDQLVSWAAAPLAEQYRNHGLNLTHPIQPQPLTGDAGFRRYFRVTEDQASWILVDAPPETENTLGFVEIARALADQHLQVPEIIAADITRGFMLLSDLGDQLYSTHLAGSDASTVDQLYRDAITALHRIQQCQPTSAYPLPKFDRELLTLEMNLLPDWLIEKQLAITLTDSDRQLFSRTFEYLADNALSQPQVFVHRDYHCRNLMICPDNNPGIIDFQDAVMGPVTYDLVSLLKDCYVKWPDQKIEEWALIFFAEQQQRGNLPGCSAEQFIHWFDLMGIQRHLKAAGIFSRLHQRDNKPGYLNDIPRTLSYIAEIGERYPEIQPLANWLSQRVMPLLPEKLTIS